MHASTIGERSRELVSVAAVEGIKWLALALMLLEHVWGFALGTMPGGVMLAGRLVFPLFAIALAVGIVRKTPAQRLQLVQRLALWGAISAAGGLLVRDPLPLNVLFTFAFGICCHTTLRGFGNARWFGAGCWVVLGFAVEYGPLGVVAVALIAAWAEEQRRPRALLALTLALACICMANGNAVAYMAAPVAWSIAVLDIEVPRVPRLFYWTYAGQWPALAALKATL